MGEKGREYRKWKENEKIQGIRGGEEIMKNEEKKREKRELIQGKMTGSGEKEGWMVGKGEKRREKRE